TNPSLTGTPLVGASVTVSPVTTTTYYVTVSADGYCFETPPATVTITVNPVPPTPSITPNGPIAICGGEVATLSATSAGATGYIWYLNGTEIIGETSATLDASESGVYTVEAVNDEGCASGESAAVTVVVTPRATAADINVTGNE